MAGELYNSDYRFLRLLELGPFERRQRGGGWRFGVRTISDNVVRRLIASGRAAEHGDQVRGIRIARARRQP